MKNRKKNNLTKRTASKLLSKGDLVFYVDCGLIFETRFLTAGEDFIKTKDGELLYEEVGKTWFMTKLVAEREAARNGE